MLGDVVFLTIPIHAPREGCDSLLVCTRSACVPFQSTHPARGATAGGPEVRRSKHISIHAPREGCDQGVGVVLTKTAEFQSTHPARGATTRTSTAQANVRFQSTHPARGATAHKRDHARRILYFNPRTPRGVRRRRFMGLSSLDQFQSTHPARGATWREGLKSSSPLFQSTHPARGATSLPLWRAGRRRDFNPRTPRGVRRFFCCPRFSQRLISIHAPREGCDFSKLHTRRLMFHFNPRTPRGVRRS